MNALPESLNAIGGLDWIHLVFLWLTIMSVQLSPMLRRMLARISNALFKTKFNTNGVTTEDLTAIKTDVGNINTRLDLHEAECLRRNDEIQSDIRAIKSDVSTLKTDTAAMKTDIAWIKQLLSYRKGGSDA